MNARTGILSAVILLSLAASDAALASEFGSSYGGESAPNMSYSTDFSARRRGPRRTKAIGGGMAYREANKPLNPACHAIRSRVASVVGAGKAACYLKLFNIETDCNPNMPQRAGNAGNGYAAYGLCSMERSPAVRARQGRGAACRDISTIEAQTRCCQSVMKSFGKGGSYFGPVRRGSVGKCD